MDFVLRSVQSANLGQPVQPVQIAVHTTGKDNVYRDAVTLDGKTTQFSGMYGNSSRSGPWAQGLLSLNFQLDGINNGEKETTITAYSHGFTMIYW